MEDPHSASQAPVKEGDILAHKYRVEKVLGVGGMGVVVAALHVELDERVALKFLLPSAAQNPGVVARFNREARAAVKIKSQHVARVSDVGTLENGTPYIVMEYLEGKDLGDLLATRGRLPAGVAIDYVLQAAEAIAEAHAAGIVHRDLKPANLFLANQSDGTAIVKVLDFGISKAVIADEPSGRNSALTGTTDVFGSPTYMSPEQLKASRDVDARTDIWALGIILYELIAGRAPFERPTVAETFGSILYEAPVPIRRLVPELAEDLERAIMRCLEKDVAARTPNVAELAKALFPHAASATRASLDRTSRLLKRAGLASESSPPGGPLGSVTPIGPASIGAPAGPGVQARTNLGDHASSAPGSQTRSAWGTASRIQGPRSSRGTLVAGLAIGMLVAGAGGVLLVKRLQRPEAPLVAVQADSATMGNRVGAPQSSPGVPGNPGGLPQTPPSAPGTAAPVVSVVPAVTAAPTPSVVATATPAATTTRGKAGAGGKHPPPAAPGAPPAAATAAPATPPPKAPRPSDGDDFGDRK